MDLSKRLNHVLGPLVALLVMVYFGYHIAHGERGLFSWMRLRQKITQSEQILYVLQKKKETRKRSIPSRKRHSKLIKIKDLKKECFFKNQRAARTADALLSVIA